MFGLSTCFVGNSGQARREYEAFVDDPTFPRLNVKRSLMMISSPLDPVLSINSIATFHSLIVAFQPSGSGDHLALPGGDIRVYNVYKFNPDAT